jgi:hypothetical protein
MIDRTGIAVVFSEIFRFDHDILFLFGHYIKITLTEGYLFYYDENSIFWHITL